jgi:epoxyqueuosine reductase
LNRLDLRIKEALFSRGASLVGFADLTQIPEDARDSMRSAVSIGVALNPSVVAEIGNGPTAKYYSEYRRVNALLWELAKHCANLITGCGYHAIPREPTGVGIDTGTQSTVLPHKTVATRAGLGWIGRCALLITREYGSAVRITTVLTDVRVQTAAPINDSFCGDCVDCVESCPGRAASGKDWNVNSRRDSFFDAFACAKAARKQALTRIGIDDSICGICISVCPWTVKYVDTNRPKDGSVSN